MRRSYGIRKTIAAFAFAYTLLFGWFEKEKWPIIEAQKFFNHYQGIGWKVGGKTEIVNWQATAKNWMLKAEEIKTKINQKAVSQNQDNLKTSKNKNYNEPL